MTLLTAAELTALRADENTVLTGTVVVYRSPAATAGSVGAQAVNGTIAMSIYLQPPDGQLNIPIEVAGGRVSNVGVASWNADVKPGDEVRNGTVKYKALGVGANMSETLVALSELRA